MLEWLRIAGVVGAARQVALRAALASAAGSRFARRAWPRGAAMTTRRSGSRSRSLRPAIAVLLSSLWLLVPPLRLAPAPTTLAELELEQRDALREDHVLVGDLREHRRVVEQHGEHEEQRDREEHRRRIRLDADPARRSCSDRRARRRARAGRAPVSSQSSA